MDKAYWNSKYSVDEYVYTKDVNRFVKEHLSNLASGKMIDLAGGEGRNTVFFAERGWQAENVDLSSVGLEKCQALAAEKNVSDRVFTTNASALDFDSQLAPVDLGVCAYLQIPQAELAGAITRLVENIKPGGVFFGVWHALENLKDGFGGPQNPDFLPSEESMTALLSSLPLEIEFVTNRDGQVQTREGLKPSITLTAMAHKL
ncbi:MAG: class I SAM-dependent methyltransferase [Micrococcales bacterium]|nr:class I SAM-dependent methyltransferase [Micrococcales bacterium]